MTINGEAIYGSKTIFPYKVENICLTQGKDGEIYYFYMAEENEENLPSKVHIPVIQNSKIKSIQLLGSSTKLKWKNTEDGFDIEIPKSLQKQAPSKYVWVFKTISK